MIPNSLYTLLKRSILFYCLFVNVSYANTDFEARVIDPENDHHRIIRISANIILYGEKANFENSNVIRKAILGFWAKRSNNTPWTYFDELDNQTYEVQFSVNVGSLPYQITNESLIRGYDSPLTLENFVNLTNVPRKDARAFVRNSDTGVWSINEGAWTYAHEFGHFLGLKDRYSDSENNGGSIYSIAHSGWEGNIMASYGGIVEQRNIDSLVRNILDKKKAYKMNNEFVFHVQGRLE